MSIPTTLGSMTEPQISPDDIAPLGEDYLPANVVHIDKVTHERRVLPTVIKERIQPVNIVEIQPVIHRIRKQTEIRTIVQPYSEKKRLPQTYQAVEDMGEMPVEELRKSG